VIFFSPAILNKRFHVRNFINVKIGIIFFLSIFLSCSSTKRFSDNGNFNFGESNIIRVLIWATENTQIISVNNQLLFSDDVKTIAQVNPGNKIRITNNSGKLSVSIANKVFESSVFFLNPISEDDIVKIDGKKYRGRIKITSSDSQIRVINQIDLEDYMKGVMTKEMPIGKGNENYEALKAFSICARTYAYNKIKEDKDFFDIYPDTRDQVYGGVDGETEITNKIVDETIGQILTCDNNPAVMFYHSTCGGRTENVKNVFSNENIPYLTGVVDGSGPFCRISPRYEWQEIYSEKIFIDRLYAAKLINSKGYHILDVKINSRFESGRVNELEIILTENEGKEKSVLLIGNRMRSIIRSGDNRSILKSTLFDICIDSDKNITIDGKGSGHGVGLCQWGAIGQSRIGIDYKKILNYYFPGTKIKSLYD
jgi:stage II sporulation protein D